MAATSQSIRGILWLVCLLGGGGAMLGEARATGKLPADMAMVRGGIAGTKGTIQGGFLLERTEVTVAAYQTCTQAGACQLTTPQLNRYCNARRPDGKSHPMNCVSWAEAAAYCTWRGRRLPTVAEWRTAVQSAGPRTYPWGNTTPTCDQAIFQGTNNKAGCDRDGTWPVSSKPNGNTPHGITDLAGNVAEWTKDCAPDTQGGCTKRYTVGGSWQSYAAHLSIDSPALEEAAAGGPLTGFRCAMDIPADMVAVPPRPTVPVEAPQPPPLRPAVPVETPQPAPTYPPITFARYWVTIPKLLISPGTEANTNWDRFGGLKQEQIMEYRHQFDKRTAGLSTRYCHPDPNKTNAWTCQATSKVFWLIAAAKVTAAVISVYNKLDALARGYGKYRPDPYVIVRARGTYVTFPKQADTFSPIWKQPLALSLAPGDTVSIEVYDKDFFRSQLISRFSFTFQPPPHYANERVFRYVHNTEKLVKEVTFQFVR